MGAGSQGLGRTDGLRHSGTHCLVFLLHWLRMSALSAPFLPRMSSFPVEVTVHTCARDRIMELSDRTGVRVGVWWQTRGLSTCPWGEAVSARMCVHMTHVHGSACVHRCTHTCVYARSSCVHTWGHTWV